MMRNILITVLFSTLYHTLLSQTPPLPMGYEIIEKVSGDLDNDNIPELAVVLNTTESGANGTIREIRIFKNISDKWVLWQKSDDAILQSKYAADMQDPYVETRISKGVLTIVHEVEGTTHWKIIDKYKIQNNELLLVNYSYSYGKSCEVFTKIEYNLLNGKIEYLKEYEACDSANENEPTVTKTESENFIKKGLVIPIRLRRSEPIKITTPTYKAEFNL